jgi:hypothetical protein
MIYELRIYRCVPERKPALLSRFENETLRIWEKHGIRQAGFWTTLIGRSSRAPGREFHLQQPWLAITGRRPAPRWSREATGRLKHPWRLTCPCCERLPRLPS